jgi:hypothetical protein
VLYKFEKNKQVIVYTLEVVYFIALILHLYMCCIKLANVVK